MDEPGGSKDYNDLVEFLAMAVFAAIPLRIVFGTDPATLDATHFGVITVCVAGMILFPIRNRLRSLTLGKDGVSATLDEKRAALAAVARDAGADVAETVRPQMEKARSREAVEAIRNAAVEAGKLKINAYQKLAEVVRAIQDKKKLRVVFQADDQPAVERVVIPLDVQAGRTDATSGRDYLWIASDDATHPESLLMSNVLKAEVADESFDPAALHLQEPKVPRLIHRDW